MERNNENQGALFKADKQGNERRPDYRGPLNVNGTDYWISAWLKSSKAGQKYMSLSVQPKQESDKRPERNAPVKSPAAPFDDSDLPF